MGQLLLQHQEMAISEKLCLRWNDFQENVSTAFRDLRNDSEFTDVTLAFEDGHQVEAHKVILSASSPLFQNLLKKNKHAHPLIYMRGMKSEDLMAILDFLYYGEVNIYQDSLDIFLNIAEEMKLKGLNSGEKAGGGGEYVENPPKHVGNPTIPNTVMQRKNDMSETQKSQHNASLVTQSYIEGQVNSNKAIALTKQEFSEDMNELDEKIETMMIRGENMVRKGGKQMTKAYVCQVCGKEGQKINIKDHIEAHHLEGISIPCSLCEKTFRSRHSLINHNSNFHTNNIK